MEMKRKTRQITMKLKRNKYIVCLCAILLPTCYYFLGIHDHIRAKSYYKEFEYPLNVDIKPLIQELISGKEPSTAPINEYSYDFISRIEIPENLDLLIIVKSAIKNFDRRMAIRQTFGKTQFQENKIRTVFVLGTDNSMSRDLFHKIEEEFYDHQDLVRAMFDDNYFNNTIKTMIGFRWAHDHCLRSKLYLFTDDDMFISVDNLLQYGYREIQAANQTQNTETILNGRTVAVDNNKHLFAGYLFRSSPHRHWTSKWRVSYDEYPYDMWPPYITAGAYVLSYKTLKTLYFGSKFVKHFRFDDIFLGLVAKKAGVPLSHCDQFYFYKKKYSKEDYNNLIASHGYDDPEELKSVWKKHHGYE